ncbi:unnamed protein product, partial [Rotaria sordida]
GHHQLHRLFPSQLQTVQYPQQMSFHLKQHHSLLQTSLTPIPYIL